VSLANAAVSFSPHPSPHLATIHPSTAPPAMLCRPCRRHQSTTARDRLHSRRRILSGPPLAAPGHRDHDRSPTARGANSVVMLEHVIVENETIRLSEDRTLRAGDHIVTRGSEAHSGDAILPRVAAYAPRKSPSPPAAEPHSSQSTNSLRSPSFHWR